MIECRHWDCGKCNLGLFGGRPSEGICRKVCQLGAHKEASNGILLQPTGPGTELKALLAEWGIAPGNCACNAMAAKMDAWGPDGCKQRMEEIVVALTTAAEQRGWMRIIPFKELGARGLVLLAISKTKLAK